MFKPIIKTLIINKNINNFLIQCFRMNSSGFEKMPVFKSELSLDKLYHKSDPISKIIPEEIKSVDKFDGYIPIKKLDISYSRSGGPGGQHVNTTDTKVTVKFHLSSADWIPNETKQRLLELHKNNINKEGFWMIRSDKTRAQLLNLADCMDKIRCYITEASKPLYKPSIESLEKIRENREKSAIRRLETKKQRSMLKSERRLVD